MKNSYPLYQQLGSDCYIVRGRLRTYCLSINLPRILKEKEDDQTSGKSNVEQKQTHVYMFTYTLDNLSMEEFAGSYNK